MSGYAGGSGEMNGDGGLNGLLAQLRKQSGNTGAGTSNGAANPNLLQNFGLQQANPYFVPPQAHQTHASQHGYHQPSVSSPLMTPSVNNQPPHQGSAVIGPATELSQPRNMTAVGGAGSSGNINATTNLLNLLKFSQPTSASTPSTQQAPIAIPHAVSREPSRGNSDLLATLMGVSQSNQPDAPQTRSVMVATVSGVDLPVTTSATAPSADTQAYLLQLLNRPKPAQTDVKPHRDPSTSIKQNVRDPSQDEVQDLVQTLAGTSLGKKSPSAVANIPATAKPAQGLFTYVNPFDQLAESSPRNRTPTPAKSAPSTSTAPAGPAMQILKPPRHTAHLDASGDLKRKVDDITPSYSPALSSKRKQDLPAPKSLSPDPTQLPDGRTQLEALLGIGASGKRKETVTKALTDVGSQVDKQVEQAIARAEKDESQVIIEKDIRALMNAKTDDEFEEKAQTAAIDIKKELEKEGNEGLLEKQMPLPVAQAVKDLITNAAKGNVVDSWESASIDDSPKREDKAPLAPVFSFPITAFQSITVQAENMDAEYKTLSFRSSSIMDVARMKKEFDQIDRTLATASNDFIVYGMSKNGGIRVIRQQDGHDLKLFTETKDRVFNVACSNSTTDPTETVLGTGISGTVYWAAIKGADGDYVETESPEKLGFALPPFKASGEESSGGVVKTRARKSSNHPEFFAVGRGKSIHIIWPHIIMKQGYLKDGIERLVDVEKYLSHRSLKINTGKAGKDFTFSPDDSTIVSLDKAGRVKFWDVRTLTQTDRSTESCYPAPEQISPIEIKEPMMTLTTTNTNEKSWPTSVMFVDKITPYQKLGFPLRFLIVGMKQNHTLQLWDIILGRPVQEINLPHTKESDAVCSVMYHPESGIIVVGHPTRNSIYLIHLSTPNYKTHKSVSQADFITKLANKDSDISRPKNTCILSGMREYSLEPKGLLRSLEILPNPTSSGSTIDRTLFELYAMHSKGVTCIYVKLEDYGWTAEKKVIWEVDALQTGMISMVPLAEAPPSESATNSPAPTRSAPRILSKDVTPKEQGRRSTTSNGNLEGHKTPETPLNAIRADIKTESPRTPQSNLSGGQESGVGVSPEKVEKKKKKKSTVATKAPESQPADSSSSTATPAAEENSRKSTSVKAVNGAQEILTETALTESNAILSVPVMEPIHGGAGLSQESVDEIIKKMGSNVSSQFSGLITSSFDTLYRRVDDDQRTQAAISDSRQEALLRLVSSTLSDNVEKTLSMIVSTQIKKAVLPNISQVAAQTVKEELGAIVGSHIKERLGSSIVSQLKATVPKEMNNALPDALAKTLQKPEAVKLISEAVVKIISFNLEENFASVIQNSIVPTFNDLAVQVARDASKETNRQAMEVIAGIERKRQADTMKIEQLTRLVNGMGEMLSTMADSQKDFQDRNLKMWQQSQIERQSLENLLQRERQNMSRRNEDPESIRGHPPSASVSRHPSQSLALSGPVQQQKSEDEQVLTRIMAGITHDMAAQNFEEALIKWLQSDRQQEIFESYFIQIDPSFVRSVSPLVLLSLSATCTVHLDGKYLHQRLIYLEAALQSLHAAIDDLAPEVAAETPRILDVLVQRLETLFMRISQVAAQDPLLKRLASFVTLTKSMISHLRR